MNLGERQETNLEKEEFGRPYALNKSLNIVLKAIGNLKNVTSDIDMIRFLRLGKKISLPIDLFFAFLLYFS